MEQSIIAILKGDSGGGNGNTGGGGGGQMSSSRSTLIGVAISLTGNVLISLALNCQKLAHTRVQRESQGLSDTNEWEGGEEYEEEEDDDDERRPLKTKRFSPSSSSTQSPQNERNPGYGSTRIVCDSSSQSSSPKDRRMSRSSSAASNNSIKKKGQNGNGGNAGEDMESSQTRTSRKEGVSTEFLRSRLWWLGLGLMSLGEFGNFLSYAYAPASLVAPLGAVALLSNVIFAPILLNERFRPSDLGGILLAIIGAVTVVFSSKQSDITLNPDELQKAILRTDFLVYTGIVIVLVICLAYASSTDLGYRYILLDVGVCALFGGFTVLSTKGFSSLLSLGRPFELIKFPITYVLVMVLIGTALAQITYLNRALQRFDSREVIPTQFVTFTISAIVGSAILYRDFANMDAHRLINFLFGCLTTFAGVFILTREKNDGDRDMEYEELEEGREEVEAGEEEQQSGRISRLSNASQTAAAAIARPVAVPRTHPAAVNFAGRGKKRLRTRASTSGFPIESLPTVALHRSPNIMLSTSLQDGTRPIIVARRSIFNPAFTIAYLDPSMPSTPRRAAARFNHQTQQQPPSQSQEGNETQVDER